MPDAAEWSEAVPQGIFRSAFLRVYPAVYVSDTFVRTSVANQTFSLRRVGDQHLRQLAGR